MAQDFRDVDPGELRVPPSRAQGADPFKLARPISLIGAAVAGMPPACVYEGSDGVLMLYNGVTRATRIAKLAPGTLISRWRMRFPINVTNNQKRCPICKKPGPGIKSAKT